MSAHGPGSLYDLFIGGVQIAIADVVHDGAGEDEAVLHHHAHLGPQGADGHGGDVRAVYEHLPGIHVVEPGDQVHDGGLAGAGGAYESVGLSLLCGKADIVQDPVSRLIAEAHIPEFHLAPDRRHFHGTLRVLYQDRLIDGLEDALQVGDGGEQRVVEIGQRIDGCPEAPDVGSKSNQYTYRQCGVRSQYPADAQHVDERGGDDGNHVHAGS